MLELLRPMPSHPHLHHQVLPVIQEISHWPVWCPKHRRFTAQELEEEKDEDSEGAVSSECYFAVKGAALVLPQNECMRRGSTSTLPPGSSGADIHQHLQAMFCLLRPGDTLKTAVKLESIHRERTRYLVVVSCNDAGVEESCLLGVDCNDETTIGLVLPLLPDTTITLDGDGGFSVNTLDRQIILKPVSVQAMWSALQTLHRASSRARDHSHLMGSSALSYSLINYYEEKIGSDQSCVNEWNIMDDLESKRPPSPNSLRLKPTQREETEKVIRAKLKEIMMTVDLDEVTSKYIRSRIEEDMQVDLVEYKPFIDKEMLTILGQMDQATEVFPYLYLGSEWNASNLEELHENRVSHILNVTREIDNFFPGMFDYQNIRVYDDEATELLKHWDKTYKYILHAKKTQHKCLVHCKMGVSRSASTVLAYIMKEYGWDLPYALQYVKNKRNCIKPNSSFMRQLETYQGILDASRQRHNKLFRSRSETCLIQEDSSVSDQEQAEETSTDGASIPSDTSSLPPTRPKSWSPEDSVAAMLFPEMQDGLDEGIISPDQIPSPRRRSASDSDQHNLRHINTNVLLPCSNGQSYSVSQSKAMHLSVPSSSSPSPSFSVGEPESPVFECLNPLYIQPDSENWSILNRIGSIPRVTSVKDRIHELEERAQKQTKKDKRNIPGKSGIVLTLANQFESGSKPSSPVEEQSMSSDSSKSNSDDDASPTAEHEDKSKQDSPDRLSGNPPFFAKEIPMTPGTVRKQRMDFEEKAKQLHPPVTSKMVKSLDNLFKGSSTAEAAAEKAECRSNTWNQDHSASDSNLKRPYSFHGGEKIGDQYSTNLDKVFAKEEKRESKKSVLDCKQLTSSRECPSRTSSFGSCDSAIVLRESPSRQSSWGSCDARGTYGTLGFNDMRLNHPQATDSCMSETSESYGSSNSISAMAFDQDDPFSSGTVRRSKRKINREGTCSTCSSTSNVSQSYTDVLASTTLPLSPDKYSKVHGPLPYRNPSAADKVPSLMIESDSLIDKSIPEGQMIHYASTPALWNSRDEKLSPPSSKLTLSQPNIPTTSCSDTLLHSAAPTMSECSLLSYEASSTPASHSLYSSASQIATSMSSLTESSHSLVSNMDDQPKKLTVMEHKKKLEKWNNDGSGCEGAPRRMKERSISEPAAAPDKTIEGNVKRLTQKLEGKSGVESRESVVIVENQNSENVDPQVTLRKEEKRSASAGRKVASAPTISTNEGDSSEEPSVRSLVGKFEVNEKSNCSRRSSSCNRPHSVCETSRSTVMQPPVPKRKSSLDLNSLKGSSSSHATARNSGKPPVSSPSSSVSGSPRKQVDRECRRNNKEKPPLVARTSNGNSTNAAKKPRKQQGKTHPLNKLTVQSRHSNPVFNTM